MDAPSAKHTPAFHGEALKLAQRIGVTAAARELGLYEPQLYTSWCKQQQQLISSVCESELAAENARLKRQLAEQAEALAILQKAATCVIFPLLHGDPHFIVYRHSSRSA